MISLENATIRAGDFQLDGISLDVPTGEIGVLMGRNGAGKTTIAEAICGLRTIRTGRVVLGEQDVTLLPPAQRDLGYVPQDGVLFRSMSVERQVALPLILRGWQNREVEARVRDTAELLGFSHLLERGVDKLSGGEKQRVALGRALIAPPTTLVLDEPFVALDESTRTDMCDLLKRVQQETKVTTLHITHSRKEAAALADRQFLLEDGELIQQQS